MIYLPGGKSGVLKNNDHASELQLFFVCIKWDMGMVFKIVEFFWLNLCVLIVMPPNS